MEPLTVDKWIYNTLSADAQLMALVTAVYSLPAPATAVLPYVVFQEQTSDDLQGVGAHRIGIRGNWLVRGVAKTSTWSGNIDTIANRIDTLLQAGYGNAGDGVVWACVRIRPFRLIENVTSGQFRHNGGQYLIWAT